MIRPPPRSTPLYSSAASDVYKRQAHPGTPGLTTVALTHLARARPRPGAGAITRGDLLRGLLGAAGRIGSDAAVLRAGQRGRGKKCGGDDAGGDRRGDACPGAHERLLRWSFLVDDLTVPRASAGPSGSVWRRH